MSSRPGRVLTILSKEFRHLWSGPLTPAKIPRDRSDRSSPAGLTARSRPERRLTCGLPWRSRTSRNVPSALKYRPRSRKGQPIAPALALDCRSKMATACSGGVVVSSCRLACRTQNVNRGAAGCWHEELRNQNICFEGTRPTACSFSDVAPPRRKHREGRHSAAVRAAGGRVHHRS